MGVDVDIDNDLMHKKVRRGRGVVVSDFPE